MLETFRKHHYILMCFIAVAVIIAFTFLSNPNDSGGGPGGSSQRVGTLYGRDFTLGEVQNITQEQRIAGQLAMMAMDREGKDPVSQFGQAMGQLVDTARPRDSRDMDIDYPTNVLVMREECRRLGIDVERADLEKFIKEIGAFKTNGTFDAKKLEEFLTAGPNGDRAATETKLFTALRDVLLFQRLSRLVGGTYAPSKAEIDADYAQTNQRTTAAAVLISKKDHENQTVTDEEVQKFYDAEKAKKEAPKADDKTPAPVVDPMVLSEEKRTVKYVFTEAPVAPVAPTPPATVPPLEDVSKLPEDQKKAKEEEHKKKMDEYKTANEGYQKLLAEHTTKTAEHEKARKAWLESVANLSNALVAEERGAKSFEDLAKEFSFEVKTATFTQATLPEDLKKIKLRGGDASGAIFAAQKGGTEELLEDQAQSSFGFFTVAEIETAAVLPLDQVKQKISDKLKAEKVAASLKAAAESARSNLLEAIKGGKSFKEAAEAAKLTAIEPPAFGKSRPIPADVANGSLISAQTESLNAGEMSQPVEAPDGLLLVYVIKKELMNHPQMAQQKEALVQARSYRDAAANMSLPTDPSQYENYFAGMTYFNQNYGGMVNPVLKAWFSARRSAAQTVAQ